LSKALRISPELSLPLDFATEGVIVLGMRGSGKSNTEARFAEVEYAAGIPFVVVDPKGDWHGIRTSADGTKAGLAVPVFGGLHGDFPLDASLGKRIADLLVDENLSAMLDVSRMSKTVELPRFLADFFDQLMLRHQEEPHVRTVILEEAHRYIPQQVPGSMARVKEAAGAVLLEGRAWGLGCWACSQRPARINKDILEEVSTAILHRIGPMATNDKRTIAGWVKHYDLSDEIIASITKLRDGEGWVLAPVSLGILQRVQMDRRQTFDSAATPKVGAKPSRAHRPWPTSTPAPSRSAGRVDREGQGRRSEGVAPAHRPVGEGVAQAVDREGGRADRGARRGSSHHQGAGRPVCCSDGRVRRRWPRREGSSGRHRCGSHGGKGWSARHISSGASRSWCSSDGGRVE
jgi:hypothetical protein